MSSLSFLRERVRKEYQAFYADKAAVPSFFVGLCVFLFSTVVNYFAGSYATEQASVPVRDIILSNLPRIDTSFFHAHGVEAVGAILIILTLFFPRRSPFLFKTFAFLILVRAAFINMTNLGIYPDAVPLVNSWVTFGGDLFFSGHVANMFLLALIFGDIKPLRYLFLGLSVLLGATVLLGHYHYTIDVFAAPFIAYGVFKLSQKFFTKDFARLKPL